ncbi:Unc-93 homolog A (C. elegans) [Apodemus speciosus]|uniref:Protein unc-93 homolog A n=1 Tax=Apodemus speciosus TaxID=105296 RepID=A0ABQ0FMM2_APOSI
MERSLKNVLVVSCGFLLLFTAYGGLQNLQSSLHSEQGLGVATLSTLYASVLLSSMFLPPILIKRCGCKWTIVGSMCCYVVFSLGNFHANWYTLIPTSILLGLGAAPLWSAQGTYLTTMGNLQAEKAGKLGKDVVNQYFGIFFLVFQSSGVWGNLISSLVFGKMSEQEAITEEQLMSCGAKDCLMGPVATNSTHHPSQQLIYTLLGIYTSCGVLAILLVAVLLESVEDKLENERERGSSPPPLWSTLLSTFMLFRDKRLCFLMFLPLYSGFQQGFLSGEYTKSYVTCALGIHFVGYVMICFSAMTALCSLLYGKISKHTGRAALYALALFGVLFEENKEPAFANYRLGEAVGYVIAFGYSSFLCVSTKLYILLGVLSLAMVGYGAVEYLESKTACKVLAAEEKNRAEEEDVRTEM